MEIIGNRRKNTISKYYIILHICIFYFSESFCNLSGQISEKKLNVPDSMRRFLGVPLVVSKVHIFWEGHKILRNLPLTFDCRGATGAACAHKPGKTPIMAARHRCRRRLLFFKIEVRPRSCRSYNIWHPCTICTVVKSKGKILQNFVAFSEYMNFTVDMWNMTQVFPDPLEGDFFSVFVGCKTLSIEKSCLGIILH